MWRVCLSSPDREQPSCPAPGSNAFRGYLGFRVSRSLLGIAPGGPIACVHPCSTAASSPRWSTTSSSSVNELAGPVYPTNPHLETTAELAGWGLPPGTAGLLRRQQWGDIPL